MFAFKVHSTSNDKVGEHGGSGGQRRGYHGRGRRGFDGGVGRQPTFFSCEETIHLALFCTKPCALCGYFQSEDHAIEDYPQLVAKWEEKRGNYSMVIVELCEEQNLKAPMHVGIVNRGGACIRLDVG